MVQNSQGQPHHRTWMFLKPCKSWDISYQPQLVNLPDFWLASTVPLFVPPNIIGQQKLHLGFICMVYLPRFTIKINYSCIPRTQMTPIFEGQPPQNKASNQNKALLESSCM